MGISTMMSFVSLPNDRGRLKIKGKDFQMYMIMYSIVKR